MCEYAFLSTQLALKKILTLRWVLCLGTCFFNEPNTKNIYGQIFPFFGLIIFSSFPVLSLLFWSVLRRRSSFFHWRTHRAWHQFNQTFNIMDIFLSKSTLCSKFIQTANISLHFLHIRLAHLGCSKSRWNVS